MLNLSDAITDTNTITEAAHRVGLPFEVVELNEAKVRQIYQRDFVLVRPDGHVAWRGNELPASAAKSSTKCAARNIEPITPPKDRS